MRHVVHWYGCRQFGKVKRGMVASRFGSGDGTKALESGILLYGGGRCDFTLLAVG